MTADRLKLLLTISIVVNLFALGGIGGAAGMWLATSVRRPIRSAGDALPSGDRQRYHAMLQTIFQQAKPLQQSARDNRRAAGLLFTQPTFDAAAVDDALSRARDADVAIRTEVESGLVAFAASLPQDERQTLAKELSQGGGPLRQPKRPALGRQRPKVPAP